MATIPEGSLLTALRGYVGCPPGHITAVSRLQDGNRHAVYKVSYLGPTDATEDLVVRVAARTIALKPSKRPECSKGRGYRRTAAL